MRVVAGQYRRRQLRTLAGQKLRPTSDRLRETLFNVLSAGAVPMENSVWFDLFAGSGAIGIEALSRGAAMVYLVESHRAAATVIKQNLASLGIKRGFEILQRDSFHALQQLATRAVKCDFCFLDPPYAEVEVYASTLAVLANLPLLHPTSVVIAEHDRRFDPGNGFTGPAARLQRFRQLRQGDSTLSFYTRA
jgi:16S rRNA (guanine(966)-N(2))-methyltransferase RsmD